MFNNQHFVTTGVMKKIPVELRQFMWKAIAEMEDEKDYLQVFRFSSEEFENKKFQRIEHEQEDPDYEEEYKLEFPCPVNEIVYIIDYETHSIMMLSEEYGKFKEWS